MHKIYQIAKNTFRESMRDKVLYVIVLFALMMMLVSLGLGWISVGEQLQVVQHFSLATLSSFGALIAVFVGTGLIYKEIDKRTIYIILSKPVRRYQFLLGKFFGLMAVLALALIGMCVVSLLFVAYVAYTAPSDIPVWTSRVNWSWYVLAIAMIYLEIAIVISLAILFGTLSSPILSAIFTFTAYLIGQISNTVAYMFNEFIPAKESVVAQTGEYLTDIASSGYWLLKPLSLAIFYVLPDLQHFQFRNQVVFGPAPTLSQIINSIGYAAGYSSVVLLIAIILFDRRRF